MKLSFNSKSQEFAADGSVKGTRVVLSNNDGGFLPVMLPADKINLSNTELEKLALDYVYQENFPHRAENERFDELSEKIAKYDEMINKMQKAIDDSEKMTKLATATLNGLLNHMYGDEETEDETTKENETTEEN